MTFIDPLAERWLTGDPTDAASGNAAKWISEDNTHPTLEGQAYLADRLIRELRTVPELPRG